MSDCDYDVCDNCGKVCKHRVDEDGLTWDCQGRFVVTLDWLLNSAPRDDAWQFENWVGQWVLSDPDTMFTCSLREAGIE